MAALTLAGPAAAAFTAPAAAVPRRSAVQMASIEDLPGATIEVGGKVFDPLGLADMCPYGSTEFEGMRTAEVRRCPWVRARGPEPQHSAGRSARAAGRRVERALPSRRCCLRGRDSAVQSRCSRAVFKLAGCPRLPISGARHPAAQHPPPQKHTRLSHAARCSCTQRSSMIVTTRQIKHGRVCMAASVGWIINEMGIHFPGKVSLHPELTFAELGTGLEAWANLPVAGKAQILTVAGLIEVANEIKKPVRRCACVRWERAGPIGEADREKRGGVSDERGTAAWPDARCASHVAWQHYLNGGMIKFEGPKANSRLAELKNGRAAMIAVASFYAASTIPGSVPAIPAAWQ
eukprot:6584134-Prymnesium_polylepis.2